MRIDLTSAMFNMPIKNGGGTPSWGTSLGQGEGHKYTYEGCQNILVGMLYKKISNYSDVKCPLGKGGAKQSDYSLVLASVFSKIFVNRTPVNNASFILAIYKQMVASPSAQNHIGRQILKYNKNMEYQGSSINDDCYQKIAKTLGISPDAAWFITDIDINNQDELHFTAIIADSKGPKEFLDSTDRKSFCEKLSSYTKTIGGYNKIIYGAPGCGKSHYVEYGILKGVIEKNKFRTTFYPDYTNTDFVGQILPTIEKEADPTNPTKTIEKVSYRFNPGPFTLALKRALETNEMVFLIIEEINRGNASAIFGDLFQLLDRIDDPTKPNFSFSEYPIKNINMQKYLGIDENDSITIPSNLTILATMNTSDQNVFTLDTAFKRRWKSEQISNDIKSDNSHPYKSWFIPGTDVTWETFLIKINTKILDEKFANATNEDKRLGKYFVSKECLTEKTEPLTNCIEEAKNFAHKVLEYIWNDVCRISQSQQNWFDITENNTLETLIESFNKKGLGVFTSIDFKK